MLNTRSHRLNQMTALLEVLTLIIREACADALITDTETSNLLNHCDEFLWDVAEMKGYPPCPKPV